MLFKYFLNILFNYKWKENLLKENLKENPSIRKENQLKDDQD